MSMLRVLAALCLLVVSHAITCHFPRCICLQLQSITYFCSVPVQDLSGYGTQLAEIDPGTFSQASFVTNLSLANNAPLLLYSGSFQGLTNVTQVDLSGNAISSLPDGVFSPMSSLTSLNLSNNALSSLNPFAFTGLNNLTILSLGGNMLTRLPLTELFEAAPSLNAISLFPNPINCSDDNITDLFQLARSGVITDSDQLYCSNGTKFTELNFDTVATTTIAMTTTSPTTATTTDTTMTTTATPTTMPTTAATTPTIAATTPTTATTMPTTAATMPTTAATMPTTAATTPTTAATTPTTAATTPTTAATTPTTAATTPTTAATTPTTATPTTAATMTTTAMITTTPLARQCPAETTILQTGYYEWPLSLTGDNINSSCPTGPPDGVAVRNCLEEGVWSTVDESQCDKASETVQILAALAEVPITAETSASVASQLAVVTSDPSGITVEELSTVVEIAEQLIHAGRSDVQVLNETLQAIDTLVAISTEALAQASPQTITNLRDVLDSLLLGALSVDKRDLVLSFTNLAVGGAYLPPTSDGRLLTVIHQDAQRGVETIQVGGANSDGDILVDIEGGAVNSSVQITVYNGDELFMESNCSNASNSSVGGVIVGPIISVINEGTAPNDNEVVTIQYNQLNEERAELVCVRWTTDQLCGQGRWTTFGCTLTRDRGNGVILCTCQQQGTYAIFSIPGSGGDVNATDTRPTDRVPSNDESTTVTRIVFYTASTLPQLFYLTVIVTVLVHRHLRSEALYQVLVSLSLCQGLTHLLLVLSYELSHVPWLCYSLGLLFHYSTLVTLNWQAILPIVTVVEVFKRLWYEKSWIIAPFVAFSTIWPAIPVVLYGGLRYSVFDINSSICWLEASIFPNTFTYLFAFTFLVTMVTLLVTFLLLCCSDYSLHLSTYLHILAMALNTLAFLPSILLTFFTASAQQFNASQHNLLAATSISVLISGAVLFVCLGVCRGKIRTAMFCLRERDKTANYAATWQEGEQKSHKGHRRSSALSLILRGKRRRPTTRDEGMNTNYIDDYLGYTHSNPSATAATPIPLAMLGQVQRQGRVKRNSDMMGGANGAWSQHRLMGRTKGVWSQNRLVQSSEA